MKRVASRARHLNRDSHHINSSICPWGEMLAGCRPLAFPVSFGGYISLGWNGGIKRDRTKHRWPRHAKGAIHHQKSQIHHIDISIYPWGETTHGVSTTSLPHPWLLHGRCAFGKETQTKNQATDFRVKPNVDFIHANFLLNPGACKVGDGGP